MSNDSVAVFNLPLLSRLKPDLPPQSHCRNGSTGVALLVISSKKIPLNATDGFPQFRSQGWKSWGEVLLETARLWLAVEVTEFDLTVARVRKHTADRQVSVARKDSRMTSSSLGMNTTAEIGDKTQFTFIALGAKYASLKILVLVTTLRMMTAYMPVALLGERLATHVAPSKIRCIAAAFFAALGMLMLHKMPFWLGFQ